MHKLTAKQSKFIDEYLIDLNATQACIRAGYSKKTAGQMGDENLKKPEIKAVLQQRMDERVKNTKIDAEYVLQRLTDIDRMDVMEIMTDAMTLKPLSEWPKVWRQSISALDVAELFTAIEEKSTLTSILKKIKWPDKTKNLELLARHFGMLTDRKVITTPPGQPIEHRHTYGSTELLRDFYQHAAATGGVPEAAIPGGGEDLGPSKRARKKPKRRKAAMPRRPVLPAGKRPKA